MSTNKKSGTRADFEKVLNQLYTSRPTKLASMMSTTRIPGAAGNIGSSRYSANANFLAPKTMPSTPLQNSSNPIGDQTRALNELQSDPAKGTRTMTSAPDRVTVASVKESMSQEEMLNYYASSGQLLGTPEEPVKSKMSPREAMALGGIGAAGLASSRLRGDLGAKSQLRSVRNQLMDAVDKGAIDKNLLKTLNRELNLRGASKTLSNVTSRGIADAQLLKAEKSLSKHLTSQNTRALLPILATTLLGTAVYNKLSDN